MYHNQHLLKSSLIAVFLFACAFTVKAQTQKTLGSISNTEPLQQEESVRKTQEPTSTILKNAQDMQAQQAVKETEAAAEAQVKEAQDKARALEIDKPTTGEWRARQEQEDNTYQNTMIGTDVSTLQANKKMVTAQEWQQRISTTELELQQTSDPAVQQKLQNKIARLRKLAAESATSTK